MRRFIMYDGIKDKETLENALKGFEYHYDAWPDSVLIHVDQQELVGVAALGIPVFVGTNGGGTPPPEHAFFVIEEDEDAEDSPA